MKNKHLLVFSVLILITLSGAIAFAETRYVIDQIIVNLREGKGTDFKTIKTLKTGTPLEVLDEDSSYVRVRTKTGEEGFVAKQYVTKQTPSPLVIQRLQNDNKRLTAELDQLKKISTTQSELKANAEDEIDQLDKTLNQSRDQLKQMQQRYEDLRFKSEHIVQLAEERDLLDAENKKLSSESLQLRQENEDFRRSQTIRWFLAGGGVFLFGWVAGKISRKGGRRDHYYR